MDACIGGTIIVEALRATLGQVIVLALKLVLPNLQFCGCLLYHHDSSTHQLPPKKTNMMISCESPGSKSAPLAMPRFLEGPVIEWAWKKGFPQLSQPIWDIPMESIPHSNGKHPKCHNLWQAILSLGAAVEGILKRPVPFQKVMITWDILTSTIQTATPRLTFKTLIIDLP